MHPALSLFLLLSLHVAHSHAACNESETGCTAGLVKSVLSAFSTSGIPITDAAETSSELARVVADFGTACLGINQDVLRAVRLLVPSAPDDDGSQYIRDAQAAYKAMHQRLAQDYSAATGYRLELTSMGIERIEEEVLFQLQTNVSLYDAWVLDVPANVEMVRTRGVAALDSLLEAQAEALQDGDVHPFFQNYGAMYEGNRVGVVLSGKLPLLYWRRDVFAAHNLSGPPASWEDMLAAGRALAGHDLDGDGQADPPLCWRLSGCEDAGLLLGSMLASMTQYEGSSSGWLLRPDTMATLATGPPLRRALTLLRNLSQLAAPASSPSAGCVNLQTGFLSGRCAMTIAGPQHFKATQLLQPYAQALVGNVGVAPVPGSSLVWDRDAAAWIDCNTDRSTCPYASAEVASHLTSTTSTSSAPSQRRRVAIETSASNATVGSVPPAALPPPPAAAAPAPATDITPSPPAAGVNTTVTTVRVNRAPFFQAAALLGSVSARAPVEYQQGALAYFAQLASPAFSWDQLLSPYSDVGPFRRQHLSTNITRWTDAGFDPAALVAFLTAWREALESPNAALPLRLPGTEKLEEALLWAAQAALDEGGGGGTMLVPLADIEAGLAARLRTALDSGGTLAEVQKVYWRTINYTAPGSPTAPSGGGGSGLDSTRLGVVIAAAVSAGLVIFVAVFVGIAARRRRRSLFGRALAPGASPATSLLVTDIVDSTRLWETVPATVMSRAVQLHHDAFRSLLAQHNGYESATEGDSFILSFYTAADAVAFALRAQAALLQQPWPSELMELDLCRPKYVLERQFVERSRGASRINRRTTSTQQQSPGSLEATMSSQQQILALGSGSPRAYVASAAAAAGAATNIFTGELSSRGGVARGLLAGIKEALGNVGGTSPGSNTQLPLALPPPQPVMGTGSADPRAGPFASLSVRRSASALASPALRASSVEPEAAAGHSGSDGSVARGGVPSPPRVVPVERMLRPGSRSTTSMPQITFGLPQWLQRSRVPSSSGVSANSATSHLASSQTSNIPQASSQQQHSRRPLSSHARASGGVQGAAPSAGSIAAAATLASEVSVVLPADLPLPEHADITGTDSCGGVAAGLYDTDTGPQAEAHECGIGAATATGSHANAGAGLSCREMMLFEAAAVLPPPAIAPQGVAAAMPASPPPARPQAVVVAGSWMSRAAPASSTGFGFGGGVGDMSATAELAGDSETGEQDHITSGELAGAPSLAVVGSVQSGSPWLMGAHAATAAGQPSSSGGGRGIVARRLAALPERSALAAALRRCAWGPGSSQEASAGSLVRSQTLSAHYQRLFRLMQQPLPGAVCVLSGLQVRMGVHSGVAVNQVSYNRVAGRTQYSGAALEGAKAVSDAAQGGMVLLSGAAQKQLTQPGAGGGGLGGSSAPTPAPASRDLPNLLHMGLHVTKAGPEPVHLYLAQLRELMPRLALLGPSPGAWVRTSQQVEPGVLEAPMEEVALAAISVVGVPTLMDWDKDVTEEALATFRRVAVSEYLWRLGGHLVEEGQGKLLAAFGHPYDAIRWVTACEPALKAAPWSPTLLEHELAEEVAAGGSRHGVADAGEEGADLVSDGVAAADPCRLVFRGLRIKAAVDCGFARCELVQGTGRMIYKGGLMGAVQRIAGHITTGQVVATARAWHAYAAAAELLAATGPAGCEVVSQEGALDLAVLGEVAAAPLGVRSIRGARDKVELWSVWLELGVPPEDDAGVQSLYATQ